MPGPIVNNAEKERFECDVDGELAYIEYRFHNGVMVLMHTFVPEKGRGTSLAREMAKHVFDTARQQSLRLKVYCPYLSKYLTRHPEYADLVTNS